MKKSVIITIGIIYIFAIVVVGFLGIKMRVYHEEIYVEEIKCISSGYKYYDPSTEIGAAAIKEGFEGYITVNYQEGLKVELKCQVLPDNASNRELVYVGEKNATNYKVVPNDDGTATVEFLKSGVAVIIVRSADSMQKQIKIKITAIARDW